MSLAEFTIIVCGAVCCVLQAAMPVIAGRKSKLESFAGANVTYTIEAMMSDKKALQV